MYFDELKSARQAGWHMDEKGLRVEDNRHYESLFALGTGYMTVRSSVEEGFCDDDQSVEYVRLPVNVTLEKQAESKSRYGTFLPVVEATHPFLRVGI